MYNVHYDTPQGTKEYLMNNCDKATAEHYAALCTERYVGKPYPNGKGHYDVTNVRIVEKR